MNGTAEVWLKDSFVEKKLLNGEFWNGKFEGITTLFIDEYLIDLYFNNGKLDGQYMITDKEGKTDFKDVEDNNLIMEAFNRCSIFKNLTSN